MFILISKTYLAHELCDNTVECGALVTEAFLSCAESAEVFSGAGHDIGAEGHLDAANWITTCGDIEEDDGVGHVSLYSWNSIDFSFPIVGGYLCIS